MKGRTRGFTIIEVMLFLAISAFLFVIAFSYTNSTIRNTSFSDDTNQLTNFLQRQYLSVKSVQSSRSDTDGTKKCDSGDISEVAKVPGASDTCMVIGKLLYFNVANSEINVLSIIGDTTFASDDTEIETIRSLRPRVLVNGSSVVEESKFALSSRLTFSQQLFKSTSPAPRDLNVLALIRSPISENVYSVSWDVGTSNPTVASTFNNSTSGLATRLNPTAPGVYEYVDKPIAICVREDNLTNRRGAVEIPSGQTSGKILKTVTERNAVLGVGMACTI